MYVEKDLRKRQRKKDFRKYYVEVALSKWKAYVETDFYFQKRITLMSCICSKD